MNDECEAKKIVGPICFRLLVVEYRQIIIPALSYRNPRSTPNPDPNHKPHCYRNPDRKCDKIENCNLTTLLFWVLLLYVNIENISYATAIQAFSLILAFWNSFLQRCIANFVH